MNHELGRPTPNFSDGNGGATGVPGGPPHEPVDPIGEAFAAWDDVLRPTPEPIAPGEPVHATGLAAPTPQTLPAPEARRSARFDRITGALGRMFTGRRNGGQTEVSLPSDNSVTDETEIEEGFLADDPTAIQGHDPFSAPQGRVYENEAPVPDPGGDDETSSEPVTSPSSTTLGGKGERPHEGPRQHWAPPAVESDRLDTVRQNTGSEREIKKELLDRYNRATQEVLNLLNGTDLSPTEAQWSQLGSSVNGRHVAIAKDGWEETLTDEIDHDGYRNLAVEVSRQASSTELSFGIDTSNKIAALQHDIDRLRLVTSRQKGNREITKKEEQIAEMVKKYHSVGARTEFKPDEGNIVIKLLARPDVVEPRKVAYVEHMKFSWSIKPSKESISTKQVEEIERALRLIKGEPLYSEVEKHDQTRKHTHSVQELISQGMMAMFQAYGAMQAAQAEIAKDSDGHID